jgi:hypothetical protein
MKIINDIEKNIYTTIQFIKDTSGQAVERLINSGELDFQKNPRESAMKLISVVQFSIDQGYLQSARGLKKSIEKLMNTHDQDAHAAEVELDRQERKNAPLKKK